MALKGIVFTEFLELVESAFSPDMADRIMANSHLPSGGAYTAVGTYDGAEMGQLVSALSAATQTPVGALLETFGRHLFGRFVALYPAFFEGCHSSFDFLPRVGDHIHFEVRKLYPDAELPTIKTAQPDPDTMDVTYMSPRCMAKLARGLIEGCIAHFQERMSITEADRSGGSGEAVTFTLRRQTS
jgi:hypothetical protein